MMRAIIGVSARGILGRRRTAIIVLLAAVPILIAVIIRLTGSTSDAANLTARLLDTIVVRTVLPVVAVVLGTSVLGSELEDGTAVYLLVKPIARWRIVVAKYLVAGGATAVLVALSALGTGLVVGGGRGAESVAVAGAVAVAIGGFVYVSLFLALSVVTSRALVLGLAYTLIWEGTLAGLLEGTQVLSIREYTLAIARGLIGGDGAGINVSLAASTAVVLSAVVLLAGLVVASRRLAAFETRGGD
jgi:ABC-2 type transport system permease protein